MSDREEKFKSIQCILIFMLQDGTFFFLSNDEIEISLLYRN